MTVDDREDQRDHMARALALAERGWGQTAPNPMVGAVVVRGGEVVGEGWHTRYGAAHAEVEALRAAGERARGATMYVTLEPCAHSGKTPPCTDAIIAAGVSRVEIAAGDPNPAAAGGAARLRAAGVEVIAGVGLDAALELNAAFFASFAGRGPWVTLKLAVSMDSAIADASGRSRWITGGEARREVHRMRAGHDAIAVGIGTALADDPSLTVREVPAPRVAPTRVVFDRGARLPLERALVRTAREVPTVVVVARDAPASRARALEGAGVRVLRAESLAGALGALGDGGIRSLLVEGGARLAGALLERRLVDRLVIFRAPVLLGEGALGAFAFAPSADVGHAARYRVLQHRLVGDDAMTVYAPAGEGQDQSCSPASSTT
ncbi:MAG: bifunctional diaminohydroxyphosphoribosylaminopyrimidine deaminase/5-amino-6-(5-phosphoribosylamino)uracil reductase RibD [Gemmatimonadaceae bacterium]